MPMRDYLNLALGGWLTLYVLAALARWWLR